MNTNAATGPAQDPTDHQPARPPDRPAETPPEPVAAGATEAEDVLTTSEMVLELAGVVDRMTAAPRMSSGMVAHNLCLHVRSDVFDALLSWFDVVNELPATKHIREPYRVGNLGPDCSVIEHQHRP